MQIKKTIDSDVIINFSPDSLVMGAGEMGIATTKKNGNFIVGPLSITSPHTSVRIGGIYKFHPLLMTTMPSTMISPIPTFKMDMPAKQASLMVSVSSLILSAV